MTDVTEDMEKSIEEAIEEKARDKKIKCDRAALALADKVVVFHIF